MKKSILLASALALASASSMAVAADGTWFVRGEAGRSDISGSGIDGRDDTYGIRSGYFFNPNFAVEGFYTNYAKDSDAGARLEISGFGAGVVGKKNFGPNAHDGFFISGRAGLARIQTDVRISGVGSAKANSTKLYAGVAAGYDFTPNVGLSLNYDYTKAEAFGLDIKPKTLTLGLEYRF